MKSKTAAEATVTSMDNHINTTTEPKNELEIFLQKARLLQAPRTTKASILTPYRDRIMFAYDNKIPLTTLLKTLEGEGIKTSYDNLRAYILRQKQKPVEKKADQPKI